MPASGQFGLGGDPEHRPPIVRFYDDAAPPPEAAERRPINWWSLGSVLTSAVCCLPGTGLIGIILGAIGIFWHKRIKANRGDGPRLTLLSWFGIVFGIPTVLVWTAMLAGSALLNSRQSDLHDFVVASMKDLGEQTPDKADYLDVDVLALANLIAEEQIEGKTLSGSSFPYRLVEEGPIQGANDLLQMMGRQYTGPWTVNTALPLKDDSGAVVRVPLRLNVELVDGVFKITRIEVRQDPKSAATTQPSTQPAGEASAGGNGDEPPRVTFTVGGGLIEIRDDGEEGNEDDAADD